MKYLSCCFALILTISCSNIGTDRYEWIESNDTVIGANTVISYKYPDNLVKSVYQNNKTTLFISFGFPAEPTVENPELKDDCRLFIFAYDSLVNIDTLIKDRGTDAFACESTFEKKEIVIDSEKALRVTIRANDTKAILREMIFLNHKNNLYEFDANNFSAADLDTFIQHFKVVNAP